MNPVIRDYKPSDFEEVNQLWQKTGMGGNFRGDDEIVIEKTLQNGGRFRVMIDNSTQQIIGTSWITNDQRRLYLHHFGIKPEFQGRGLANLLLEDSLKIAKQIGFQIKIEVHKSNYKALNLYKKNEFGYLGDYEVYIIRNYNKGNIK